MTVLTTGGADGKEIRTFVTRYSTPGRVANAVSVGRSPRSPLWTHSGGEGETELRTILERFLLKSLGICSATSTFQCLPE